MPRERVQQLSKPAAALQSGGSSKTRRIQIDQRCPQTLFNGYTDCGIGIGLRVPVQLRRGIYAT